jgi:branched-chain amino acid transport system ATP-binding protein
MLAGGELGREVGRALAIFPELGERLPLCGRSLSGGQKQMLSVAQALVSRPRFLLIDELSLGLAPAVVNRLANALKAIVGTGVGILLIEQFTTLALALASRAYVLERGQIVFAGTSAELGQRPDVLHSAYLAGKATV